MRAGTGDIVAGASAPTKTLAALQRIGGHAALDFVNTVDWRGRPAPEEYLADYAALVEWACYVGLVDAPEAAQLRRRAADEPTRAAAVLRGALVLREGAHRLFLARALGKPGAPDDIAIVNDASALRRSRLRLALPRHQPESRPPLVLDGGVRQPREGAAALRAPPPGTGVITSR